MCTIKVVPISNVRFTSAVSVFTSLSWSADIFRVRYRISVHMRLRVKEGQMERYSGREDATAKVASCFVSE